jgi:hypothetical protein
VDHKEKCKGKQYNWHDDEKCCYDNGGHKWHYN